MRNKNNNQELLLSIKRGLKEAAEGKIRER